jgi:ornithine cyclodeaminase/alanine dehydrogenase-like protein (mu-crystallin family)
MPRPRNETPTASRRDFLKRSTAGASLAGAASLAIGRSAHAAGSDTIRIGMIGSGNRCSGAAAEALRAGPDVKLVAMCDVFDERLQAARKNLIKLYPEQVGAWAYRRGSR